MTSSSTTLLDFTCAVNNLGTVKHHWMLYYIWLDNPKMSLNRGWEYADNTQLYILTLSQCFEGMRVQMERNRLVGNYKAFHDLRLNVLVQLDPAGDLLKMLSGGVDKKSFFCHGIFSPQAKDRASKTWLCHWAQWVRTEAEPLRCLCEGCGRFHLSIIRCPESWHWNGQKNKLK